MEGDWHFSHDHPLTSFVVDEMEVDVSDNYHFCKICGLPILFAPSYTCTTDTCDFFLHESCALIFQQKINHPTHRKAYGDHTLHLREGSPSFTYKCQTCSFEMHPLAAAAMFGVEIKTKHKSHPPHPLVALRRETFSLCDACGEKHEGFFFCCQLCDFWIHQDCTILPTAITLPSRPLPLLQVYSISSVNRFEKCIICNKSELIIHNAIYFCPQTGQYVHVRCGLQKMQSKTRLELIQLPDDELDTFPSLEIRTYSQPDDNPGDEDRKLAIENFHKHPLTLVGDESEDHNYNYKKLVCDICIQTITIPSQFYRCSQQTSGCSFLAHKVCVELLPFLKFEIGFDKEVFKAQPCPYPDKWFFSSIFFCIYCCLPSNAACYRFPEDVITVMVDLSCMVAPSIIKHSSHSQHLFFRTTHRPHDSPISCCSRGSSTHDVYRCTYCDFYIHIRCALLPKRVRFRKFDQHPLHLITISTINGSDHDICEVCEEDIECKYWFYHCAECDYSFHVNCIPSLGYLSRVKFGGKSSMPCHSHPLTLKRMLTYGRNERCGYCSQIILGLVDQAAFSCSQCDYWIHFSCARDSHSSSHIRGSMLFEEFNK